MASTEVLEDEIIVNELQREIYHKPDKMWLTMYDITPCAQAEIGAQFFHTSRPMTVL